MILYVCVSECDQVNENKPNFNTHAIDRSAFHSGGMKAHSLAKGHSTHPGTETCYAYALFNGIGLLFLCD
uniref:Uncharacterized protein n=1 Tax=Anguilla anguilla TaxID=7936 RepID=A0A0E9WZA4_ANGAN